MKSKIRALAFVLTLCTLLSTVLSSCSSSLEAPEAPKQTQTAEQAAPVNKNNGKKDSLITTGQAAPAATEEDLKALEALYTGRTAYYGDIHCHPIAGVAKDGKRTLAEWKVKMVEEDVDFVAFMNHKQVAHMYEAEWDDTLFIGGTEPGTGITDSNAKNPSVHYNMFFREPEFLLELLAEFPEYKYTGGKDGIAYNMGTFSYPKFTTARFQQLIEAVKAKGGLFVNVHPKQQMESSNPEDYYFADYTGLEVFYGYRGTIVGQDTKDNYKLWTDLLASGKRLWATAGSDSHQDATNAALTCIYSEEQKDQAYLDQLTVGDFTAGFVGIRMVIGDAKMGSSTDFAGKRLVVSVGDIHSSMYKEEHTYLVNIISSEGVVYTGTYNGVDPVSFAIDCDENVDFYRVEVLDEKRSTQPIIAIGNPIWND
ncbi:MAG: hypothetical protein E7580_06030 [Ruminococcaceae bacterium]|nr:hypothetical protein [Oscillospiraceae bacterium]